MEHIEWLPSANGGIMHAVLTRIDPTNRNSLCFVMCEREPYSPVTRQKLARQRKPMKCSRCLRKIRDRGQD